MIIWGLALVLFGCLGVAGWSFGAVRAAFALLGLLGSLLMARLFGHSLDRLLGMLGVKNPVLVWLLGPLVIFLIALIVFKVIGLIAHRKVELYYKYQAGDLRLHMWRRLNTRLGICLGQVNAALYLILISMVIYIVSQVTTQLSAEGKTSWPVKLVNAAGRQLQSSGMAKVAAAVDPMPASFYQAADLAGLIYHNDLLEARLGRYPAFLALGERPVFQDIATDKDFTELRQRQPAIREVLRHPKMQPIVGNPELLREIWGLLKPNMTDLEVFLRTMHSETFGGEPIVGRWEFNLNAALSGIKDAKPNIGPLEMQRTKNAMAALFAKTRVVAAPEKQLFWKDLGRFRPGAPNPNAPPGGAPPRGGRGGRGAPPAPGAAPGAAATVELEPVIQGRWSGGATSYQLNFARRGNFEAEVKGDRMNVKGYEYPMVFDREF